MVDLYIRNERFEEALKACEDYREGMGKDPSVLGFVEYLEGKVFGAKWEPKEAQRRFEKAIQDDPDNIVPYEALARILLKEDKFEEAVLRYRTVLRKYPKHLDMYMVLGTIYDLEHDREKAETYYRKALEVEKDFAPAANNLAWNLAEMGGHIDEALAFAQAAKEKMPRDPRVLDTLGWVHFLRGSYEDAAEEFQDSLELDIDNPMTYYHLGLAYYKNNQLDSAREVLEAALEINRDFQGAEEASSILQEIGGSVPLPRDKVGRRAPPEDTEGIYGALQEIKGPTQPEQKRPTNLKGLKKEEKEDSSGSDPLDELP
jgi:tetratricopeptide (TPR) repeat protein